MTVRAQRRGWAGAVGVLALAGALALPAAGAPAPTGPPQVAHHSCATHLKGTPTCIVELSARLQRALGNGHPAARAWVRTTAARAGVAATTAPSAQRRRPVLVAELQGPFPADGSPLSETVGNLRAVRFVVDPSSKRVVAAALLTADRPPPPPLGRLGGHPRIF
ncbi:MAG: hypothetical protein AB7V42_03360 [Thermoleophilia bacterium]